MTIDAAILSKRSRQQATTGFMVATAMQAADATIVNVALPRLEQSLGGGIDLGSWVITRYLCAAAVVAPLTGWLCRYCGARRLFAGAISLFVLASLLSSAAPSATAIIVFRLIQGAAGGILQPLAQATLLDIYPKHRHARIQAIWGATIMTGPVLGPVLGGVITDLASWRWIFVLNVPLGVISMLGLRSLPQSRGPTREARIDWIGLMLVVIGVGALQLCLQRGIGRDWLASPDLIAEAAIASLASAVIAIRIMRSSFTLFSFDVFRDVNFTTANFYNFMVGALLFTTVVFLPALREGPFGSGAALAGVTVSPRGIAMVGMMFALGWLIDRVDHRVLLATGLIIMAGALALIPKATPESGAIWLAAASAVQGVGAGMLFGPMSTLAFSTLAVSLRADAAGVYILLRQLGGAAGVAAMTALLQARIQANIVAIADQGVTGVRSPSHLLDLATFGAYTDCFRTMAVITAVIIPGIFLFRVLRPGPALSTAT